MNKRLPTREQATTLLLESGVPSQVVNHCLAVADYAKQLAQKLQKRHFRVNVELVEAGAVLHDLGRAKTNTVNHSLVGAQLAQSLQLPQPIVDIIKRHVGAGITQKEAEALGWPQDVYVPQTLEEKIVCYADKRIDDGAVVPIEAEIAKLQCKGKMQAAERVRNLHEEITGMLGEAP
ncbi:MAG: HDIG domain-containing protein [Candidatus Bathyarchaeota archaeon]|nr:HDIG domain-containing protein [Candidatus Bathyarchaeota archaeon]